jgi:ATP-dependent helicase/nuclease subunit A
LAEINFIQEEDFELQSVQLLVEQVKQLQDNGLSASEIAILIRKNSEGPKIVETFLEASKKEENAEITTSPYFPMNRFFFILRGV